MDVALVVASFHKLLFIIFRFTTLSVLSQGIIVLRRIGQALNDAGSGYKSLSRWSPTARLCGLWEESDRCEQKVNKHPLAESRAYI